MSLITVDYGEIVGGGIDSLVADTSSSSLGTITGIGQEFIAQENAIMIGYIYGSRANSANLTIYDKDGNDLGQLLYSYISSTVDGSANNCKIGNTTGNIGVFIPKGYKVASATSGSGTTYNLTFYKVS